jgi:histidyl-tRNA synthetase
MLTRTPRGTKDIYGKPMAAWRRMEDIIRDSCAAFALGEIRTPVFEHTDLFLRGVGEESDIAQKEMYTFLDKGGRSLSLRPEMTAGAARAFVEHKLYAEVLPAKFFYMGPNFRYEKPAAGRWRQFHQFGAEIFGSYHPAADAEIISLAAEILARLSIDGAVLHINSLGGPACRAKYNERLKSFLAERIEKLCPVCQTRYEKNPLRTLDCKDESCQASLADAPTPLAYLDTECQTHFEQVQRLLQAMGIPFLVNSKVVRGLDYYTRTVFEFIDSASGLTVCGGGRYDGLIEQCGGPPTGAVGFGMGLERILLILEQQNKDTAVSVPVHIFIGSIGEAGFVQAQALTLALRRAGIAAEADIVSRGVKAQMKYADKIGARFSIVLGDNELASGKVILKVMGNRQQREIALADLRQEIKKFSDGSETK